MNQETVPMDWESVPSTQDAPLVDSFSTIKFTDSSQSESETPSNAVMRILICFSLIYDHCDLATRRQLCVLNSTCLRHALHIIQKCGNMNIQLKRYVKDVHEFKRVIKLCKAVVTGSTVLQALILEKYDNTDLDIVCPCFKSSNPTQEIQQCHIYSHLVHMERYKEMVLNEAKNVDEDANASDNDSEGSVLDYSASGFDTPIAVTKMSRGDGFATIDLVHCLNDTDPRKHIRASFYSTHVMNAWSPDDNSFFSAFPELTKRQIAINVNQEEPEEKFRGRAEKYINRGFKIYRHVRGWLTPFELRLQEELFRNRFCKKYVRCKGGESTQGAGLESASMDVKRLLVRDLDRNVEESLPLLKKSLGAGLVKAIKRVLESVEQRHVSRWTVGV
ncbi:hypothetical protein HDU76_004461 [Blyttiomyces sp. JEL0837]|nr:hypothetical protein HDU76_004461 [Blyttiomyces sp. JEL0837]